MATVVSIGSGVTHFEWRLQGFLATLNAVPVLLFVLAVTVFGFFAGIFWPILGWIVFGFLAGVIALYAVFCLLAGRALWHRKEWGLIAGAVIYLFYILVYFWAASTPPHPKQMPDSTQHHLTAFSKLFGTGLHLLMVMNVTALIHIVVRWIRFRSIPASS